MTQKRISAVAVAKTRKPGESLRQQSIRTGIPYKTLHNYAKNGFPRKRSTTAARVHAVALGLVKVAQP